MLNWELEERKAIKSKDIQLSDFPLIESPKIRVGSFLIIITIICQLFRDAPRASEAPNAMRIKNWPGRTLAI